MAPTTTSAASVVLEPAAAEFAAATAEPPYLLDLGPDKGRTVVDDVQSGQIAKPPVNEQWITVPGGPTGSVPVRVVRPAGASGILPVIIYIHGAGWVFGNARTHDRLVRELAAGADAAVVFPEYALSPEARYPVAIEQNYAVARWVVTDGAAHGLDPARIAVAGDSVGGNMSAALTLMAKDRGDVPLAAQVLFYPVTDASFDTGSYHQFASYAGGYALWLAYGLNSGNVPLIVVDAAGLLCGGLTLAVALSLRGSLVRPASWTSCTAIPVSGEDPASLRLAAATAGKKPA
jgi:acetyl esterase/lipase